MVGVFPGHSAPDYTEDFTPTPAFPLRGREN